MIFKLKRYFGKSDPAEVRSPVPIATETSWGHIDSLEVLPSGVLRLMGRAHLSPEEFPTLICNGHNVPGRHMYRYQRNDLEIAAENAFGFFQGFVFEYDVRVYGFQHLEQVEISGPNYRIAFECKFPITRPHYEHLLDADRVFKRSSIYTAGLPVEDSPPYANALASLLPEPILDFGCGRGNLVSFLRKHDRLAFGIELDRPEISTSLVDDVKDVITLYEGGWPLPFKDAEFKSVIACEVLEHIDDYESALKEFHRVASEMVVITVPDSSAIPVCHARNVVPWHLLEGTHCNFFTQQSLSRELSKLFNTISFARVGRTDIDNIGFYTSIVAICKK